MDNKFQCDWCGDDNTDNPIYWDYCEFCCKACEDKFSEMIRD